MKFISKTMCNYFVDVGLVITFLITFVTGIIKWPGLLPKLGINYKNLLMWRLTNLHDRAGLVMGLLVLFHIILHWSWIVSMTKKTFSRGIK